MFRKVLSRERLYLRFISTSPCYGYSRKLRESRSVPLSVPWWNLQKISKTPLYRHGDQLKIRLRYKRTVVRPKLETGLRHGMNFFENDYLSDPYHLLKQKIRSFTIHLCKGISLDLSRKERRTWNSTRLFVWSGQLFRLKQDL